MYWKPFASDREIADAIREAADRLDDFTAFRLLEANPGRNFKGLLDDPYAWGPQQTALIRALDSGHTELVATLLRAGASSVAPDGKGNIPLLVAVLRSDIKSAERLILAGADVNQPNKAGSRPLILAAGRRNEVMVERLLASGANPDQRDAKGQTALFAACWSKGLRAVAALLAKGANPCLLDNAGQSAVESLEQGVINAHATQEIARLLLPAMFAPRWWKDRSRQEAAALWNRVPLQWRVYGRTAVASLVRHQFQPPRSTRTRPGP